MKKKHKYIISTRSFSHFESSLSSQFSELELFLKKSFFQFWENLGEWIYERERNGGKLVNVYFSENDDTDSSGRVHAFSILEWLSERDPSVVISSANLRNDQFKLLDRGVKQTLINHLRLEQNRADFFSKFISNSNSLKGIIRYEEICDDLHVFGCFDDLYNKNNHRNRRDYGVDLIGHLYRAFKEENAHLTFILHGGDVGEGSKIDHYYPLVDELEEFSENLTIVLYKHEPYSLVYKTLILKLDSLYYRFRINKQGNCDDLALCNQVESLKREILFYEKIRKELLPELEEYLNGVCRLDDFTDLIQHCIKSANELSLDSSLIEELNAAILGGVDRERVCQCYHRIMSNSLLR